MEKFIFANLIGEKPTQIVNTSVVELGMASTLTLGPPGREMESGCRPVGRAS